MCCSSGSSTRSPGDRTHSFSPTSRASSTGRNYPPRSFETILQFFYSKQLIVVGLFFYAISKADVIYVEALLKFGVAVETRWRRELQQLMRSLNIQIKVETGDTALHVLLRRGCVTNADYKVQQKIGYLLLDKGLNPNLKNDENFTALHIAILLPQIRTIQWAVEYNRERQPVFNFNKKGGPSRLTLCHYAARMGYMKLLHELNKVYDAWPCQGQRRCVPSIHGR